MRIKYNKSENYKTLSDIACGECFIPKNGENVFLKTSEGELVHCTLCFKCVNLINGDIVTFSNNRFVKDIDSEVLINENV